MPTISDLKNAPTSGNNKERDLPETKPGHLPCLKFLVSTGISPTHVLGARNDQFYKDAINEYINGIEWERDDPEQAEIERGTRYAVLLFLDLRERERERRERERERETYRRAR
ncbi:hypothetical protein DPMN_123032 [Dreissena polymorpha]|uniref:Uncharacterized protein n=1 Tax=Dreissena polymorpha TaxID=45954 RepID=A0A9D4JSI6_DREPO|nr:hypothetical protein DPMN_123032 [Dreissena polymorpha]